MVRTPLTRNQKRTEESKSASREFNARAKHIELDNDFYNEDIPQAFKNNAIQVKISEKIGRTPLTRKQKRTEESKSASREFNARAKHIELHNGNSPQAFKNNTIQVKISEKMGRSLLTRKQKTPEESKSAFKESNARAEHIEPENNLHNEDNLRGFENNAIQVRISEKMGKTSLTRKQKGTKESKSASRESNARAEHIEPDGDLHNEDGLQAFENNAIQVRISELQKMGRTPLTRKQKRVKESKFTSKESNARAEHIEPGNDLHNEDNPQAFETNAIRANISKKMGRTLLTCEQKRTEESKFAFRESNAMAEHIEPYNDLHNEDNPQASENNAIRVKISEKIGRTTKKKLTRKLIKAKESKSASRKFNARAEHIEPDIDPHNEDNLQALKNNAIQTEVNSENNDARIEENPRATEDNEVHMEENYETAMEIDRPIEVLDANPTARKRTRGPTKVIKIPKFPSSRIEVEFNREVIPIGPGSVKLSSYSGPLVREHVPVTMSDWRLLSNELKAVLWESIQARFKLDEEWQKVPIFRQMGCIWRSSKCNLVRQILKAKTKKERHKLKPKNIESKEWKKFVKLKTGLNFKMQSEKFRTIRRNQMQHTCSRRGMARLAEDLRKQSNDPSSISRAQVWIKSRTRKNGEPVSMIVADAIEKVKKIETESLSSPTTNIREDALSQVLGQDKPGRLRAMGRVIPPNKVNRLDREKQVNLFQSRILKLEDMLSTLMENQGNEIWREESTSQMSKHGLSLDKCDLLDWSGTDEIVAEGRVVSSDPNELVHKIPLGPNAMKILIECPRKADSYLWRPTSSSTYIGEAEDKIIAWPANRVVMRMVEHSRKENNASKISSIDNKCKIYDWSGSKELVAEGRLHSSDSKELVNGIPLGPSAVIVWVDSPIKGDAFLWRPAAGMTSVVEAAGSKIAWPESKVVVEKVSTATSRAPSFNAAATPAPTFNAAATPAPTFNAATTPAPTFNAAASPAPSVNAASYRMSADSVVKKCKLIDLCGTGEVVAEGRVTSTDPNALVHFIPLGKDAAKVCVDVAIVPNALLWRPSSIFKYIEDVVGITIAWPASKVIMEPISNLPTDTPPPATVQPNFRKHVFASEEGDEDANEDSGRRDIFKTYSRKKRSARNAAPSR